MGQVYSPYHRISLVLTDLRDLGQVRHMCCTGRSKPRLICRYFCTWCFSFWSSRTGAATLVLVPKIHSSAALAIGNRIRDARLALGLTMDDLSELSDVSLTSIGKIERGVQSPSAVTLVRIATALNIDAGSLISGISPQDFGERSHGYTARDFLRERQGRERQAPGGAERS